MKLQIDRTITITRRRRRRINKKKNFAITFTIYIYMDSFRTTTNKQTKEIKKDRKKPLENYGLRIHFFDKQNLEMNKKKGIESET